MVVRLQKKVTSMEIGRVLSLLNSKASKELDHGLLEEAKETANEAVNYFVSTYHTVMAQQRLLANGGSDAAVSAMTDNKSGVLLQCTTQATVLLLRKIGVRYQHLGQLRHDPGLTSTGNKLIVRSTHLLRACRLMTSSNGSSSSNTTTSLASRHRLEPHRRAKTAKLKSASTNGNDDAKAKEATKP